VISSNLCYLFVIYECFILDSKQRFDHDVQVPVLYIAILQVGNDTSNQVNCTRIFATLQKNAPTALIKKCNKLLSLVLKPKLFLCVMQNGKFYASTSTHDEGKQVDCLLEIEQTLVRSPLLQSHY
jgi:hypothetical protein